MSSWSEVLGNGTIRGQGALGVPWGFKPLHAPFPLARWPMRVFAPVIAITTLAMLHPGQDLARGGAVALQLIGDDDPWYILPPREQLAEKLLGGVLVAATLHQNVEDVIVLIHRAPQI